MFLFYCSSLFLCFTSLSNGNISNKNVIEYVQAKDTIKRTEIVENGTFKELKLVKIIQSKMMAPKNTLTEYEPAIN